MPRPRRKPILDIKITLQQPPSFELSECFSYESKKKRVSIGRTGIQSSTKTSIIKHVRELKLGPMLGCGAEGQVFLANHSKTKMNFAVKVVEILDRGKRKQFRRDLVVLQNFDSRYLTKCYDVFFRNRDKEMWICLEYMDCGSLDRVLEIVGKVPEIALKKITYCILRGLKLLHESKVNHRDIKPANILINSDGLAKLADFGISKSESESASASGFGAVGTMRYLSPERIEGQKYSFNADIWALGMILYECATGKYPFVTHSIESKIHLHLLSSIMVDEIPPLSDKFSNEFKDFVGACLERNPKHRPVGSQLLMHPWLCDADQVDLRPYSKKWQKLLQPYSKK